MPFLHSPNKKFNTFVFIQTYRNIPRHRLNCQKPPSCVSLPCTDGSMVHLLHRIYTVKHAVGLPAFSRSAYRIFIQPVALPRVSIRKLDLLRNSLYMIIYIIVNRIEDNRIEYDLHLYMCTYYVF